MLIHSPYEIALAVSNQRKKLKLSQSEVADLVGLKQKTISALENKPETVKLDTLFRILAAVNLDLHTYDKEEKTAAQAQWHEEW